MQPSAGLSYLVLLATLASAAMINIPPLFSCEPASIRVLAKGNYTIEGRDLDTHELVFRAHVNKGVSSVNWDAVDLAPNATAVVTVTDQIGPSPTQTARVTAQALIQPNPTGDTTCLAKSDRKSERDRKGGGATKSQKNMVPTIIGICLGAFLLLVILLVAGMMYRRKKEKVQKVDEDSVDLNHSYTTQGKVPAGSSYMARLVPGLVMQDARPLPRDPVLESEQANYASTRRGTHYYKNGTAPDVNDPETGFELPSYGQSQRFSKAGLPQTNDNNNNNNNITANNGFYRREGAPRADQSNPYASPHHQTGYQNYPLHQQQNQQTTARDANPFASQADLSYTQSPPTQPQHQHQQQFYGQKDWGHSQTSFLNKKSSH
ncbi:uncharacterized protein UTRI_02721_B [Ustilago trichophora]|uniref:Uncharacterized protein n=1 Tax=Ustilago trichophora TaxID=86804 RepID=A0A5C3E4Z8_9BASI|nr:uncharacterized protein UTRI_02721_B [Ustilago trichophora]